MAPGRGTALAACWMVVSMAAAEQAAPPAAARPHIVLADFEGESFAPWAAAGFDRPRPAGSRWNGANGKLAWCEIRSGENGTLRSPEFLLDRPYLNFLIAGTRASADEVGVALQVDAKRVRAASATDQRDPQRRLWPRTFDVAAWRGRTARLEITNQGGTLAVDSFVLSDAPATIPTDASRPRRESHRPWFHFTAPEGWLNDPNGLHHDGRAWRLFYQHRRPLAEGTAWGAASSHGLVRWIHERPAIEPADGYHCFSGSGVVDGINASGLQRPGGPPPILLFFTMQPMEANPPSRSSRKAVQAMAYSLDGGRSYRRFEHNPILATDDYNDRDPKVFFHAPSKAWIMVLALSNNNDRQNGSYGIYRSTDLRNWKPTQRLGPGAWFWECPDLFELPVVGRPDQRHWILVRPSGDYMLGHFDGERFTPAGEPVRATFSRNYYATQTFEGGPDGRRVQTAWMNTHKPNWPNSYPGMPFNQQMAFPRELSLRETPAGLRVYRYPVDELTRYRTKTHTVAPRRLSPGEDAIADLPSDLLDIELSVEPRAARRLLLTLRGEEIEVDFARRQMRLSASAPSPSGRGQGEGAGGTAGLPGSEPRPAVTPLEIGSEPLRLRILLDRTSIEVFAQDGLVDLAGVFFAAADRRDASLSVDGGDARLVGLQLYELGEPPSRP